MIDCRMIKFINVCHAGDQGKGKFRFVAKVVIKDVANKYYETVYPVGEVLFKKDNGIVLKSTLMPKIVDRINQINDGLLLFQFDLNDKITCSLVTSDTKICD